MNILQHRYIPVTNIICYSRTKYSPTKHGLLLSYGICCKHDDKLNCSAPILALDLLATITNVKHTKLMVTMLLLWATL